MGTYEDEDTIDERLCEDKKLAVLIQVAQAVKKRRNDPVAFLQEFEAQQQFLKSAPCAVLEFPATVLRLQHEGLIMKATEKEFWPLLSETALTAAAFDNVKEQASHFVTEALASLQQVDSYTNACNSLKDFAAACMQCLEETDPPMKLDEMLVKQMKCVNFMVI